MEKRPEIFLVEQFAVISYQPVDGTGKEDSLELSLHLQPHAAKEP
jgi:hypothetical protein